MGSISIPNSAFQKSIRQRIEEIRRDGGRITIEENGVPVAALVTVRDAEELDRLEQKRIKAQAALDAIRESFEGVSEDELMNEALKAQREARDDMDRERAAAIEAIRSAKPGLSEDEIIEMAQLAIRRANDRIRHERAIAERAFDDIVRGSRDGVLQAAEDAVLAIQPRSSAAAN